MASHIVGYPSIGPKRELPDALESHLEGKSSAEVLEKVAAELRSSIWKQMSDAGIKYIPSNTFSFWDRVLDNTAMLGAVPPRYGWNGGEIGFDPYFSMANGTAHAQPMAKARWFNTNSFYTVPELGPDVKFSYASHKAVNEYKEAKELGIDTIPVIIGPVSYLLLSKPAIRVERNFDLLSLLGKILPIYKEVISDLKAAGASWIQFDEPTIVLDLGSHKLKAFTDTYSELESSLSGLNVLIETYFADIPAVAYKKLIALKGVTAFGFDFVHGPETLGLIKHKFPKGKYLFAGVVDGRNIWANDLAGSVSKLHALEDIVGKDKLVVSTSCSLLHSPVDLANETMLDKEFKPWLAFAAQKVVEVDVLAKALAGQKNDEFFSANAAAQVSRRSSPRVTNEFVQKDVDALRGLDHRQAANVSARLDAQQKKIIFNTLSTLVWPHRQTIKLANPRRDYHEKKISKDEYLKSVEEAVKKVHKSRGDTRFVVHGKPERNDKVEYFAEHLSGFVFTSNGWVQYHGALCGKPPIIFGTVSRPHPMTVHLNFAAQNMTVFPVPAVVSGPLTILNYSFVRDDKPRHETCYEIALAIKDEVEDLEKAGIKAIQIEETAFRVGLPLRKSKQASYWKWAAHCFRITNCGVRDTTQIHSHMGYTKLDDIISTIIDMDVDVITVGNSCFKKKLFSAFCEGVKYGAGIGPVLYHGKPAEEEIAKRVNKALAALYPNILWLSHRSGPKTCEYTEVNPALKNIAAAFTVLHPKRQGDQTFN